MRWMYFADVRLAVKLVVAWHSVDGAVVAAAEEDAVVAVVADVIVPFAVVEEHTAANDAGSKQMNWVLVNALVDFDIEHDERN